MKHYRYRKVTPEIKEKMIKLRQKGIPYYKIGEKLGFSQNVVNYHLNPEQREKAIKRAEKSNSKLTKEEIKIKSGKRKNYKENYFKERYHNDPEFRRKVISSVIKYQKRKRAEKNDNKKN